MKMRNKSTQSIKSQASVPMRSSSEISKPEPKRLAARSSRIESSSSVWVQWTLPSASFSLITNNMEKLQVIVEDYQSSFDWCPVYFQAKVRIFNAHLKYFQMINDEWKPGVNDGAIVTFGNEITNDILVVNAENGSLELLSNEKPFEVDKSCVNMVYTRAESENVHAKWNDLIHSKKMNFNRDANDALIESGPRFLSEVDVKVSPVDAVFDVNVLMPFLKMLTKLTELKLPENPNSTVKPIEKSVFGQEINNNNLPLVYLKAVGVRVFVVVNEEALPAQDKQDMLLFTCESFNIAPQADNPISRILIKPELYHLSQPILDVPGANVENRQYQIDAKQIGLFSGSWRDVSEKSRKPCQPVGLKSMNQNPALEWNIASSMQDLTQKQNDLVFWPLISKFDWQVIFAPAIVIESMKGESEIVAGHSFEMSCSNLNVTLSMDQCRLFSLLCQELLVMTAAFGAKIMESNTAKSSSLDSGIESGSLKTESQNQQKLNVIEIKPDDVIRDQIAEPQITRFVPVEVFLTGSKVSLILYSTSPFDASTSPSSSETFNIKKSKQKRFKQEPPLVEESDSSYQNHDYSKTSFSRKIHDISSDVGYEASEESECDFTVTKPAKLIQPLVYCVVAQPHIFLTCSSGEQRFESSIYDASVAISPKSHLITSSDGWHIPREQDFKLPIFKTKQGDPNRLGIPPSLCTITLRDFLSPQMAVMIKVERPLKLCLSETLAEEVDRIVKVIVDACGIQELNSLLASPKTSQKNASKESFSVFSQSLAQVSTVEVQTAQIIAELAITLQKEESTVKEELLFGMFKSQAAFKVFFDITDRKLNKIDSETTFSKVFLRTIHQRKNHSFMSPMTFSCNSSLTWVSENVLPVVILQIMTNHLTIQISPRNISVVQNFANFFNRLSKTSTGAKEEQPNAVDVNTLIAVKKNAKFVEQHYVDDLRAGAFHLVEINENDYSAQDSIKPYQIVVCGNQITWKYANPRTLTRVTVLPVPLVSGDDIFDYSDEFVPCSLQYWDDCIESFQSYSSFSLSEESPR